MYSFSACMKLTLCDTFDVVQSEAPNEMRGYKNADQISTDRGYWPLDGIG